MVDAGQQFALDLELVQSHRTRHLLVLQHLHHHLLILPNGSVDVGVAAVCEELEVAEGFQTDVAVDVFRDGELADLEHEAAWR